MAGSGRPDKDRAEPNEALRQAMHSAGHNSASLAKAVGSHPKSVERWLAGIGKPHAPMRKKVADELGKTIDELWKHATGTVEDDQLDAVSGAVEASGQPGAAAPHTAELPDTADLIAVYLSRPEFLHTHTPDNLFGAASSIDISGLSLNLFCQQYPDTEISRLLRSGTVIRCLFLDPEGRYIHEREAEEEGHTPGLLANLTRININTLHRIGDRLPAEAAANLHIRTYDEPIRFNIAVIDSATCIVQPYLPRARGVESPTLFIEKHDSTPGLFTVFATVFGYLWERGKPYTP